MKRSIVFALILSCLVLGAAASNAAVDLRWDPTLLALAPGETGTLSIMIDDAISIRTIDVVIEGDPDLLTSMTASPGALFDAVSCFVWEESEELEPGRWHGFAVTIGSDCWTEGPGELLRWDFTAGLEGGTLVPSIEIILYAPDGSRLDDVSLGYTVVLVSSTTDVPEAPALLPELDVSPTPFNPRTSLHLTLPNDMQASLDVFNVRGRLVSNIFQGSLAAGSKTFYWHGVGDRGEILPSGPYVFVLRSPGVSPVITKGILLR